MLPMEHLFTQTCSFIRDAFTYSCGLYIHSLCSCWSVSISGLLDFLQVCHFSFFFPPINIEMCISPQLWCLSFLQIAYYNQDLNLNVKISMGKHYFHIQALNKIYVIYVLGGISFPVRWQWGNITFQTAWN